MKPLWKQNRNQELIFQDGPFRGRIHYGYTISWEAEIFIDKNMVICCDGYADSIHGAKLAVRRAFDSLLGMLSPRAIMAAEHNSQVPLDGLEGKQ